MKYWKVYGVGVFDDDSFMIEKGETPSRQADEFRPNLRYEEIAKEEYDALYKLMYRFMGSSKDDCVGCDDAP